MGGDINWNALDILSTYYQVDSPDLLIGALIQIKDYNDKLEAARVRK